ncbi:type III toxin-antitoxin system ToxN/AbiQ family toxin [bacterium]|nr:type III toxin-antitoxin system ToxN/AbiQ family toxin [bacterium]
MTNMSKLNIYKIDDKYIEYLKQFDKFIAEPKNNRPYVGTLIFSNNNFYYFATLTSKTNKPEFYCVNLCNENGEKIAGVRINNMIPILKKDVIKIAKLIKYEKLLKSKNPFDIKYGNLLKQEVMALNKKIIKDSIYKKAKKFYNGYKYKNSIKKICCDFKKLEEKSWEYKF